MMKKRYIFTTAAATCLIIGGMIFFMSGSTNTPELKGYDKAVHTIENKYGTVETGDDYTVKATVRNILTRDTAGSNDQLLVTVEKMSDTNVSVLFCLADDSAVIEATEAPQSFVNNYVIDLSYKEDKYHNDKNYALGSLAYYNGNEVSAILTEEAKFECSSVWAFNKTSNEVSLIWADQNNENWAEYGK